ncbi:MAG TPA: hypothetical protein VJR89_00670, partial [Polyangiales bacterium]|nr:hypothetical protein [Polyangiales bacterium]
MDARATTEQTRARVKALLAQQAPAADSGAAVEAAALRLAEELQREVQASTTRVERERRELLARLADDEPGQVFTTSLTDRAYRSADPGRAVDAARQLLRRLGIPQYLPASARAQLSLLLYAGPFVPQLASRGMLLRLRSETRDVVLDADPDSVREHLARRADEGVRVNLNYLGEAVLGEAAAAARCEEYLALLARPEVQAISVKL